MLYKAIICSTSRKPARSGTILRLGEKRPWRVRYDGFFFSLQEILTMSYLPDSYKARSGPGVSGVSEQMADDKGKKVKCWEGERNKQFELVLQFTFYL